ncbi:MAG: DUF1957 domain-containing protein [Candidatus Ancaeobacter aquaticus]|nr:DUF1957 domain-containing protein [Candidatus Ancaeobacter aquaticus]
MEKGKEKGYFSLVLHAHLPYVRHPEHEHFLEEDWFYEAITETYIPLINVFDGLVNDNIDFRVTMSLSPSLISMFTDPLLQNRYLRHISRLIELAEKEVERTKWQPKYNTLALMYKNNFLNARYIFEEKYRKNLVSAFKKFQDMGKLEIITCGATHGFLPLNDMYPQAVRAQVQVAVNHYEKHFDRKPRGIWLPECGYYPGHDTYLKEAGIKFFFTDAHGLLFGSPRPRYGVFAPCYCPTGVAAFARDLESSKQVWSAEEGYPGDYEYRDFYRDVGYDLEHDYVKPYINSDGKRKNIGIKYYKITGRTDKKEPYNPYRAMEKAASHAGDFLFNREKQVEFLNGFLKKKPLIVSPYDAELFGHWWYEGPQWINFLLRKMACDQNTIRMVTPYEYLEENPENQVLTPSMSSWGHKGYNEVWLEGSNDWIYRHLHQAIERMSEMARSRPDAFGIEKRALNQASRELLLAQSSDWAFIMKTGTMVEYAVKRTRDHIARFTKLYESIKGNNIDEAWLNDIESKDNIFPDIDYRVYT